MSDRRVRTVREMLQVVALALREILTADELAATSTRVVHAPAGYSLHPVDDRAEAGPDDELDDDTLLTFRTFEDRGSSWMQGRETAAELYERFRSELQDFVAESAFGWGQWRP